MSSVTSDKSNTNAAIFRRSFKKTSIFAASILTLGLLVGCGDGAPPTVSAPTLEPTTSAENIEVTPQTVEPEQTIQSIIDQLKQRDSLQKQLNQKDEAKRAEGITSTGTETETGDESDEIVWSINAGEPKAEKTPQVFIPEGRDPSLAAEALAAAFALVRDQTELSETLIQDEDTPIPIVAKLSDGIRAAILAPLEGSAGNIGQDMQRGAELAIFTLNNPNIDLTFHDTSLGINNAVTAAMTQQPDIIIGPLFAEHTHQAKVIAQQANIPILSFSNDSSVAGDGVWLLGQTPEQEITAVLQHALEVVTPLEGASRNHLSVGILKQDNAYGRRISDKAVDMIFTKPGVTAELLTLNQEVLDDEVTLRAAIKKLTKWLPKSSDSEERKPRFDIIIIAGDVSFGLRVAPVLSWYDLDPAVVKYVGTSQWMAASILQEPSLTGGWFAAQPADQAAQFQSLWQATYNTAASKYAIMAFDAVALVSTLPNQNTLKLRNALTTGTGFNGYSGAFKLNSNGQNFRHLEIREIKTGRFDVVVPAKTRFN